MAKPKKHCLTFENKQINRSLRFLGISDIMDIDAVLLKRLKENLKQLTDPRQQHKTHYKIWEWKKELDCSNSFVFMKFFILIISVPLNTQ